MPKQVPPPVQQTFERLKSQEENPLRLKKIHGRFYIYQRKSYWDKELQKSKKESTYLGAISPDGVYTPKQLRKGPKETSREIFEYGNGTLAYHLLQDVKGALEELTSHAQELMVMAIIRAIDPQPLKRHPSRWNHLSLSRDMQVTVNPKHLSSVLSSIGENITGWYNLFQELIPTNDILMYDLTAVFTQSENIKIAEKSYNPDHENIPQVGVILAFSRETDLPAGIDVFCGSIKDVTTIEDFLDRLDINDVGFVFDRGFWSEPLLRSLDKRGISYVAPLRSNSQLFDHRWSHWGDPFEYRGRYIDWGRRHSEHGPIYFFSDPKLEGEQKNTLLKKVKSGEKDYEEYEAEKENAGIFGLVSNLDLPGSKIYSLYKGRQDVELAFDAMKNTLEADKTYLQSAEAVRGYFFVTMLALRVYFKILRRLKEREVSNRISVRDVTYELSKIQLIVDQQIGKETFAKVPKRAREISALFPEALPGG